LTNPLNLARGLATDLSRGLNSSVLVMGLWSRLCS
jgi:hypothetical protein